MRSLNWRVAACPQGQALPSHVEGCLEFCLGKGQRCPSQQRLRSLGRIGRAAGPVQCGAEVFAAFRVMPMHLPVGPDRGRQLQRGVRRRLLALRPSQRGPEVADLDLYMRQRLLGIDVPEVAGNGLCQHLAIGQVLVSRRFLFAAFP